MIYQESDLANIPLEILPGDTVFFHGDLWAGKTTFIRSIIEKLLGKSTIVRSPTYTYFSFFEPNIYHFDLYRIDDYETFVNIGWEEIFENKNAIRLVEWPERIEEYYEPTIVITLQKVPEDEHLRELTIERKRVS